MSHKRKIMISDIRWAVRCWLTGILSGKQARRHMINALLRD